MEYLAAILATAALLFSLMKLYGAINWSWAWVLAPVWIPMALMAVVFVVASIVLAVKVILTCG